MEKIKPYVSMSYDSKVSNKKIKQVTAQKAKFFSSEFKGIKKVKVKELHEATVNHGLIVDSLKSYVEERVDDAFAYNTQKVDLAVEVADQLKRIYEVKTATDTQSLYTAVGQLYMHTAGSNNIEKWVVLPGPIENEDLLECLSQLDIWVLWYELEEGLCKFEINKAHRH